MSFAVVTMKLLEGFGTTCLIFFVTLAASLPLGLIVCFGSMSRFAPLRWLTRTVVWVIRGTPLMLQIIVIYLGFGAGLAVFMFSGFVKSLPLEIEEAAVIDGCGPIRTFFSVVLPMLRPTLISVGILEVMWVWNDYLLPSLVLDINEYKTIPIHVQYLQGS